MQYRLCVQRKFYIFLILEGNNWKTEIGLIHWRDVQILHVRVEGTEKWKLLSWKITLGNAFFEFLALFLADFL